MKHEFKVTKSKEQTVYTLESASGGGTSSGSVASVSTALGGVQRRTSDTIFAQEAKKEAPKPRNFVAKNAKMGGAGAHKDKKKAEKQGDVKHRKPFAEQGVAESLNEFDHARHVQLLNAHMQKLGYENIGAGLDAQVFAKETGPVKKILMPESGDISTAENSFLAFYNYCQANAKNPHLPKFQRIQDNIKLDGEKFRLITMERLQEVDPDHDDMIMDMIESIEAGQPLDPQYKQHAGFYQTLKSVMTTGSQLGFENDIMDFNNSNVMQRGNTLVIADPWTEGGGLEESELEEGQYEMMMRNGQVKKFIAKDDADAKRIAAGHGAKSVIKLKGGVPAGKVSEQDVAEGDSGAKYKVKSIGYDSKGDYYISPSTGKKVYKKADKGDHENPKTGEIKKKIAEDHEIQMASSELQSIAKNAVHLLDLVRKYSEQEGLDAWQQSKITKAADYLNAVLQAVSGKQSGMEETRNNYHANTTGFSRGPRDNERHDLDHQADPKETMMWNLTIDGEPLNPKPIMGRSNLIKFGKQQAANGVDLSNAMISPVKNVEEDAYMMELASKLAEKIPPNADVDYYIKDFAKSTAPQFKGKNPAKRKQMAIAAYYGSKQKKK